MRRALPALLLACLLIAVACRSKSGKTVRDQSVIQVATVDALASALTPAATLVPELTPTPTPTPPPPPPPPPPPVAEPVRLRIPRLKVDAPIVPVGVNVYGEMDSPKDAWSVAWYAPGFKPAEPGNAVLAGHVDYINVGPAVFWGVRSLAPGDRVIIAAADEQEYEFEVKETVVYTPDNAPLDRIFGPNPNRGLVLITCTGTFSARTREYDQRTVVYTEAVKPEPPRRPSHIDRDGL